MYLWNLYRKSILNMFLNTCYKDYFFLIKSWFVKKKNNP